MNRAKAGTRRNASARISSAANVAPGHVDSLAVEPEDPVEEVFPAVNPDSILCARECHTPVAG
jgi:hypothetical protein